MPEEKWEQIQQGSGIERFRIPAGWIVLYRQIFQLEGKPQGIIGKGPKMPLNGSVAITFVPDPEHRWKIGAEAEKEESEKSKLCGLCEHINSKKDYCAFYLKNITMDEAGRWTKLPECKN